MKNRIANIVYLASFAVGLISILMGSYLLAVAFLRYGLDDDLIGAIIVIVVFVPIAAWACGWSIRYILTGDKGFRPKL